MSAGLINIGNTCAINSLLQSIFYTFDNSLPSDKEFTNSLLLILKLMKENSNKIIKPLKFINDFFNHSSNLFQKGEQLDVNELWIFLCNKIFEETSIKNKSIQTIFDSNINYLAYSQISSHNNNSLSLWNDIYQGVTITITKCNKCNEKYYNFETFYNLSIDIGFTTIIESLIHFFSPIENKDEWKCEKCNENTHYIKTTKLWSVPNVLVLSLKRFDNHMKKISKDININYTLNFKQGVVINHLDQFFVFNLKTIIHHQGIFNGGHYISSILNDDNNVTIINDEKKTNSTFQKKSNDCYMLFYQLK